MNFNKELNLRKPKPTGTSSQPHHYLETCSFPKKKTQSVQCGSPNLRKVRLKSGSCQTDPVHTGMYIIPEHHCGFSHMCGSVFPRHDHHMHAFPDLPFGHAQSCWPFHRHNHCGHSCRCMAQPNCRSAHPTMTHPAHHHCCHHQPSSLDRRAAPERHPPSAMREVAVQSSLDLKSRTQNAKGTQEIESCSQVPHLEKVQSWLEKSNFVQLDELGKSQSDPLVKNKIVRPEQRAISPRQSNAEVQATTGNVAHCLQGSPTDNESVHDSHHDTSCPPNDKKNASSSSEYSCSQIENGEDDSDSSIDMACKSPVKTKSNPDNPVPVEDENSDSTLSVYGSQEVSFISQTVELEVNNLKNTQNEPKELPVPRPGNSAEVGQQVDSLQVGPPSSIDSSDKAQCFQSKSRQCSGQNSKSTSLKRGKTLELQSSRLKKKKVIL